jgi:hypothetical protein
MSSTDIGGGWAATIAVDHGQRSDPSHLEAA